MTQRYRFPERLRFERGHPLSNRIGELWPERPGEAALVGVDGLELLAQLVIAAAQVEADDGQLSIATGHGLASVAIRVVRS